MNRLNTLIADDEPLAIELVKAYVEKTEYLNFVGTCGNTSELSVLVQNLSVDLVLLDIQMPGNSGLTFAKTLAESEGSKPYIIFTTAYDQYAIDGFKANAVDYLLKPFDYEEFRRATDKVRDLIELRRAAETISTTTDDEDFFFVKSDYRLVRINYDEVRYIEGLKDYVKIYVDGNSRPILSLLQLKVLEPKLERHGFVRLHRSYIVNVRKITGVERSSVVVGTDTLPISDGYRQKFQEVISRLML